MQLSLLAAFIPIVNILWCGASAQDCNYTSSLLNLGYSKECIDTCHSSLISCSNNEAPPHKGCFSNQENITITLTEVKTHLQEIKSEIDNEKKSFEILWDYLKDFTRRISSLEEMKSDQKKISNSLEDMKALLQEMKMKQEKATEEIINPRMNCADLQVLGDELSGVRALYPYGVSNSSEAIVFCDQVTDGGGWTVIQSRSPLPIRENFNRDWDEYSEGFGDPNGEYWLGLDNIHALTNSAKMKLRIELEDAEGKKALALYSTFRVGDAASKYVLRIGGYTGDAGDGMSTYPKTNSDNLNNMKFSTQDNDNDLYSENCAELYNGGWWYNSCSVAQLNGEPIVGEDSNRDGIVWGPFRGHKYSLLKATMKIRPVSYGF